MPYIKKELLEQLILSGQRMSNLCFNLSQIQTNPNAKEMKELYADWDNARTAVRKVKTNG